LLAGAAAILLGIGAITPVTAQTGATDNFGFIRFIHTAIDVPPLDIYIGDANPTLLVSNLAYGEATDFMSLPTTVQGFTARAAGTVSEGDVLFRLNRRVKANQSEII